MVVVAAATAGLVVVAAGLLPLAAGAGAVVDELQPAQTKAAVRLVSRNKCRIRKLDGLRPDSLPAKCEMPQLANQFCTAHES